MSGSSWPRSRATNMSQLEDWQWAQGETRSGQAAWAETFAARAFGVVLTEHEEFWEHVAELEADRSAGERLARLYVRRDQGGRVAAVRTYLERAAEVAEMGRDYQCMRAWATGGRAWWDDAPLEPGQPVQLPLRPDVVQTITFGAYRVARRGAGRCVALQCQELRGPNRGEYCARCATESRRPREAEEGERALFDALIPAVLGGPSKQRARRIRRAAPPRADASAASSAARTPDRP